jgi:hypothetical protein
MFRINHHHQGAYYLSFAKTFRYNHQFKYIVVVNMVYVSDTGLVYVSDTGWCMSLTLVGVCL